MLRRPSHVLFLVSAALFWGLGTVLTKYALTGFSSVTLLPIQLLSSAVFLVVVLAIRAERPRFTRENHRAALLGILNPGIAYALGLLGLSRIDASISVVLWATEPALIVLMAVIFLREKVTIGSVVVLIFAMLGVLFIVGKPSGAASSIGVLLTLAAVAACALYSILLRRMHLIDGTLTIVFLQQVTALSFAIVVFTITLAVQGLERPSPTSLELSAALGGGILYYGAAFWFYVSGLRETTAARAGIYLTLIPVFGLFFSWALLGEQLDMQQLWGAGLVIASMVAISTPELLRSRRLSLTVRDGTHQ